MTDYQVVIVRYDHTGEEAPIEGMFGPAFDTKEEAIEWIKAFQADKSIDPKVATYETGIITHEERL